MNRSKDLFSPKQESDTESTKFHAKFLILSIIPRALIIVGCLIIFPSSFIISIFKILS